MALNTFKCNHLIPLHFKGLRKYDQKQKATNILLKGQSSKQLHADAAAKIIVGSSVQRKGHGLPEASCTIGLTAVLCTAGDGELYSTR